MSDAAKQKMTVEEFLAWAEGRDGRWELQDGDIVSMSPERSAHWEAKGAVFLALNAAVLRAGAPCRAVPDGATVRITARTAFEPDALVYCGPRLPSGAIEVPDPIIVVEVLSAATAGRDHGVKLKGYFSLPSLMHYLIVDAEGRMLIHHRRGGGDMLETRILNSGVLRLDPPGLDIQVTELFEADEPA
jgi:Uma2 family endonuclease